MIAPPGHLRTADLKKSKWRNGTSIFHYRGHTERNNWFLIQAHPSVYEVLGTKYTRCIKGVGVHSFAAQAFRMCPSPASRCHVTLSVERVTSRSGRNMRVDVLRASPGTSSPALRSQQASSKGIPKTFRCDQTLHILSFWTVKTIVWKLAVYHGIKRAVSERCSVPSTTISLWKQSHRPQPHSHLSQCDCCLPFPMPM